MVCHLEPPNIREFKWIINLFMERFRFNLEALLTISQLYNLKQKKEKGAHEFINRWWFMASKMKKSISDSHTLVILMDNFSQPLQSLINIA